MERPWFTLTEAAGVVGLSRDAMRRRLRADGFPNAVQDQGRPGAPWIIPLEDLLAAGLRLQAPTQGDPGGVHGGDAPPSPDERLAARNQQLEVEVRHLRALLEERGRTVEMMELALRALPPAPASPPVKRRRWRRS